MTQTDERIDGAGPWLYKLPALDPGEKHTLDFREMKRGKSKRGFQPLLPLDDAEVANADSSNTIEVEFNDLNESRVFANQVQTWTDAGIVKITIENVGGSTIAAEDVTVEVAKSAYDADKAAREQKKKGFLERAVGDIVPGM